MALLTDLYSTDFAISALVARRATYRRLTQIPPADV
jgi:hypothetical protein